MTAKKVTTEVVNEFQPDSELAALIAKLEAKLGTTKGTSDNKVVFLKKGLHKVKLVLTDDRGVADYFEEYDNTFTDGNIYKYYIVAGVILHSSTQPDIIDHTKVQFIKLPKTAIRGITQQIGNEWNLFADESPVIEINSYNDGGQTKYMVTLSNKKFGMPKDITSPTITMAAAAKDLADFSARKSTVTVEAPLAFVAPNPKNNADSEW